MGWKRWAPIAIVALSSACTEQKPKPPSVRTAETRAPLVWAMHQKLDGFASADAKLGTGIAIDGATVAVGAENGFNFSNVRTGRVIIFTGTDGVWTDGARIYPDSVSGDAAVNDKFGARVSLQGDTLAVGSSFNDHSGFTNPGAVYIYRNTVGVWLLEQKLIASDPSNNAWFGSDVSLSNDRIVIGAYGVGSPPDGRAYVFSRSGTTWSEDQILAAPNLGVTAQFGLSVAMDGDTLLVGGREERVYVYEHDGSSWLPSATLQQVDPTPQPLLFSESVALDGDTAVVGGPSGVGVTGSVFMFERNAGTWTETLAHIGSENTAALGASVAIDGDRAIAGAPRADTAFAEAGVVYIFERTGGTWSAMPTRVEADDANVDAAVGTSVAIDGDAAVAGAPGENPAPGVGYVIALNGAACSDGTTCASGSCLDGVCCAATACPGDCERCDVAGREGVCSPVSIGSPGDDPCFPFSCDGVQSECPTECGNNASCDLAAYCDVEDNALTGVCAPRKDPEQACGIDDECLSNACVGGICCDVCAELCSGCRLDICGAAPRGFDPGCAGGFVCDGESVTCPTSCTSDLQCRLGELCNTITGACVDTAICDGDHTLRMVDGSTDCSPFRCNPEGACIERCTTTAQCIDGLVCDPGGNCVAAEPVEDACACGVVGRRDRRSYGWLLLIGLVRLARRRR